MSYKAEVEITCKSNSNWSRKKEIDGEYTLISNTNDFILEKRCEVGYIPNDVIFVWKRSGIYKSVNLVLDNEHLLSILEKFLFVLYVNNNGGDIYANGFNHAVTKSLKNYKFV